MKILLKICAFFIISSNIFSQTNNYIITGDTVGSSICPMLYQNPVDTSINSYSTDYTYIYFDLNNDGIDDYYFRSHSYSVSWVHYSSSAIYPIDTNCYISSAIGYYEANIYDDNDTIDNEMDWINSDLILSLYTNYMGDETYGGYWMNSENKYLGLMMIINSDTIFGWCRLSVELFSEITVHDYALAECINYSRENNNPEKFRIFLNPCSDYFYIICNESLPYVMEIFDMEGKMILKQNVLANTNYVNVTDFQKGLYMVKINNYIRKILIN